jgi:hypothetical protein
MELALHGRLHMDRSLRYDTAIIHYGQYHVLSTHASIVQVHIVIARTSLLRGQYNPFENIRGQFPGPIPGKWLGSFAILKARCLRIIENR